MPRGPDRLTDVPAVGIGQADVDHHQIRGLGLREGDPVLAEAGLDDVEALLLQPTTEQATQVPIVFDHKYARQHWSSIPSAVFSAHAGFGQAAAERVTQPG